MAFDRGCWLRDHTPTRLGAWLISAGWFSSTGTAGELWDLVVEGTAASSRRAVVVKAALGMRKLRARELIVLN